MPLCILLYSCSMVHQLFRSHHAIMIKAHMNYCHSVITNEGSDNKNASTFYYNYILLLPCHDANLCCWIDHYEGEHHLYHLILPMPPRHWWSCEEAKDWINIDFNNLPHERHRELCLSWLGMIIAVLSITLLISSSLYLLISALMAQLLHQINGSWNFKFCFENNH